MLYNATVHGILEPTATLPIDRAANDFKLLSNATQLSLISLPSNIKLHRLGRANNKNPRSVKTIFNSRKFNVGKRTHDATGQAISISVSRDRTILERHEIRQVYVELEVRKKSGEHNIAFKYRNRIPFIAFTTHGIHY